MDIMKIFKGPEGVKFIAQNGELITLDASISENHATTSKVTRNPVEDGSNISDHVINEPASLSIEGVVSDTPLSVAAAAIGVAAGIPSTIFGGTVGAIGTAATSFIGNRLIASSEKKSITAYQALLNIQTNGVLLTVQNKLKQYNDMILENLVVTRTAQTSRSLRFTATLTNVVIVTSEIKLIPKSALDDAIKKRAQEKAKQGVKQTKEASTKIKEKGSSWLKQIGGLFS